MSEEFIKLVPVLIKRVFLLNSGVIEHPAPTLLTKSIPFFHLFNLKLDHDRVYLKIFWHGEK